MQRWAIRHTAWVRARLENKSQQNIIVTICKRYPDILDKRHERVQFQGFMFLGRMFVCRGKRTERVWGSVKGRFGGYFRKEGVLRAIVPLLLLLLWQKDGLPSLKNKGCGKDEICKPGA